MLIRKDIAPIRQLTPDEARANLERLRVERRESYAGLGQIIERGPGYLSRYVRDGIPQMLSEADSRELARYFGVSAGLLGSEPDPVAPREFAAPLSKAA